MKNGWRSRLSKLGREEKRVLMKGSEFLKDIFISWLNLDILISRVNVQVFFGILMKGDVWVKVVCYLHLLEGLRHW